MRCGHATGQVTQEKGRNSCYASTANLEARANNHKPTPALPHSRTSQPGSCSSSQAFKASCADGRHCGAHTVTFGASRA